MEHLYEKALESAEYIKTHTKKRPKIAEMCIRDRWYTGDFEATWQDVLEGCTALLEELR